MIDLDSCLEPICNLPSAEACDLEISAGIGHTCKQSEMIKTTNKFPQIFTNINYLTGRVDLTIVLVEWISSKVMPKLGLIGVLQDWVLKSKRDCNCRLTE